MWKKCVCDVEQSWVLPESKLKLLCMNLQDLCEELKQTQSEEWETMLREFFEEQNLHKVLSCSCNIEDKTIDEPELQQETPNVIFFPRRIPNRSRAI